MCIMRAALRELDGAHHSMFRYRSCFGKLKVNFYDMTDKSCRVNFLDAMKILHLVLPLLCVCS